MAGKTGKKRGGGPWQGRLHPHEELGPDKRYKDPMKGLIVKDQKVHKKREINLVKWSMSGLGNMNCKYCQSEHVKGVCNV